MMENGSGNDGLMIDVFINKMVKYVYGNIETQMKRLEETV